MDANIRDMKNANHSEKGTGLPKVGFTGTHESAKAGQDKHAAGHDVAAAKPPDIKAQEEQARAELRHLTGLKKGASDQQILDRLKHLMATDKEFQVKMFEQLAEQMLRSTVPDGTKVAYKDLLKDLIDTKIRQDAEKQHK